MNKRQRKKREKKIEERLQRQAWEQRQEFIDNINTAVAKVKGWIEAVPKFIDKQVQERPEALRDQLLEKLDKGGQLLRWEQLLLDKVNVELERRASHDDQK